MSWIPASLVVLGAALAAGFAWYERTRPSSRMLALVATLAALAAAGRVAFAPIPNVKPTTDIVLIAGFALGGAPGLAVGALAALASNFFFGQGYWTPWQMAAWGLVGLLGAALARATGRRLGRAGLAAACGVAGAAFGVVMNLSTWVSLGGSHTLGEFLAISGAAAPFDAAHLLGNVLFCLAFGPALLRAIERFRLRSEVTWLDDDAAPAPAAPGSAAPGSVARGPAAVAVLAALALAGVALAAPAPARAASASARYVTRAQNRDGGFGAAPGAASSQLQTGWAALGLAAAGRNPLDVRRAGRSPVTFIRRGLAGLHDTGDLERTVLVLAAAGVSPRAFGGRDLVGTLLSRQRPDGSFGGFVNWTAFGVLALRAVGQRSSAAPVRRAAAWILRQQNADGGWSFARRGAPSGVDDTSAPVQALVAAGRRGAATSRALRFLRRAQNADGGFPLSPGGASNAQSTAWAIQGAIAGGASADGLRRAGATRPAPAYLRSLVAADGSVRYSRVSGQTPVWVTAQALVAFARTPFPLPPVPRARAADRSAPAASAPAGAPASAPAEAPAAAGARPARPRRRGARSAGLPRAEVLALARAAGAAAALIIAPSP
ncbi:MAG: prenyltransferase/squalene oxidase repeat-containing protein [Solirubrobacteraceae bacterium]